MNSTAAYVLYAVLALGAVAMYFLLPGPAPRRSPVAVILGAMALVALLLVIGLRRIGDAPGSTWFYLFSALALIAAARVITHPRPVYSALYFVLVVVAVAALLVLLRAEFLAVALIIIYAGAIMVTYLFVIMLAHQPGSPVYDRHAREPFLAVLAGFVLTAAISARVVDLPGAERRGLPDASLASATLPEPYDAGANSVNPAKGNTESVGDRLMARYVVAFQLAGVLLLVSMVGAIAMSRKRVPPDPLAFEKPRIGEAGKKVLPF